MFIMSSPLWRWKDRLSKRWRGKSRKCCRRRWSSARTEEFCNKNRFFGKFSFPYLSTWWESCRSVGRRGNMRKLATQSGPNQPAWWRCPRSSAGHNDDDDHPHHHYRHNHYQPTCLIAVLLIIGWSTPPAESDIFLSSTIWVWSNSLASSSIVAMA